MSSHSDMMYKPRGAPSDDVRVSTQTRGQYMCHTCAVRMTLVMQRPMSMWWRKRLRCEFTMCTQRETKQTQAVADGQRVMQWLGLAQKITQPFVHVNGVWHRGQNPILSLHVTCRWCQFFSFRCSSLQFGFRLFFGSECDLKLVCCGFRLRSSICMTDDSAHIVDDKTFLKNATTKHAGSFFRKGRWYASQSKKDSVHLCAVSWVSDGYLCFQIGFRLVSAVSGSFSALASHEPKPFSARVSGAKPCLALEAVDCHTNMCTCLIVRSQTSSNNHRKIL